jgi:hypothetical protein
LYEWHADNEFRMELRRTFDARYWEMYLTTSLIFAGYEVTCPKPGPDVGIIYRGQRIWFEAVAPDCGDPGKPDSVPTKVEGEIPEAKKSSFAISTASQPNIGTNIPSGWRWKSMG